MNGNGRPNGVDQAKAIARATFDGFLQSDLMPAGMQAPAIIWAAAFLVGPSLLLPAKYLSKYPFLRRFYPSRVEPALWDDRLLLLILSAGAIGLVAVIMWDTLLPARRDAYVLAPMPVAGHVQMAGRLSGLGLLFAAFALTLNVAPALLFPLASSGSFMQVPRLTIAHLVTSTAADGFVFFSITSIQGVAILALGRRGADRLAAIAQAGAVVLLLLTLLFIDPIRAFTREAILGGAPPLRAGPSAWFLGLYGVLGGTSHPGMGGLALAGALAAAIPVAATVALYALGYRRLIRRAVEMRERSTRSALGQLAARLVRGVFVHRPEDQAVCSFVFLALARSPRQRMLLSAYVGAAIALIATAIIPDLARHGLAVLATPAVSTLSAPLALSAALAVGIRVVFAIPTDLPARWIFQMSALTPRRAAAATHKAMLLLVLPPVAALAAGSAAVLWGWQTAWQHALFCGALALVLCELLLLSADGVPFTRPYVPGGARVHMLWPAYLTAFITYTYSMAALERALLQWGGLLQTCAGLAAAALALWMVRRRRIAVLDAVSFEAEMRDEMFAGFNLSEGLAANYPPLTAATSMTSDPSRTGVARPPV